MRKDIEGDDILVKLILLDMVMIWVLGMGVKEEDW